MAVSLGKCGIFVLGMAGLCLAPSSARAEMALSGIYDPTGDANDVDRSATFASSTGAATSANVLDYSTFQALVADAFIAGSGGVMNFDTVGDSMSANTVTSTAFGVNDYQVSFIHSVAGVGNLSHGTGTASENRVPTSGGGSGGRLGKGGSPDIFFDTITLANGQAGEGVTHFGFTLLHRVTTESWNVSATFSDGSTVALNQFSFATGGTANTLDTFIGFVAPTGATITGVRIDGTNFTTFDDLGFITNVAAVPEPGTWALLGVVAAAAFGATRRRKC